MNKPFSEQTKPRLAVMKRAQLGFLAVRRGAHGEAVGGVYSQLKVPPLYWQTALNETQFRNQLKKQNGRNGWYTLDG
ncbi:hypothetical protein RRG08_047427 [Elysia crispata]|uniref:Uncharacterized protein n=1 Tax=Elysia crispata TaxID=231223 RepID=A0AAE0YUX7_9GAST|nr:hypothetical protein RRG08_047427 [Elysia crispata]